MNVLQQPPVVMLGGFPLFPHDHLCVFFRGRDERDRLLLPFLSDGLSAGDAVRFVADAGETSAIRSALGDHGDLDLIEPDGGHLRNGQ